MTQEQRERDERIVAAGSPLIRLFNNPDFKYWKEMHFDKRLEQLKDEVMMVDMSTPEGKEKAALLTSTYQALRSVGDKVFKIAVVGVDRALIELGRKK